MTELPLKGLTILVMEDEYLIALDVEQLCRDNGAEEVVIMRKLDELGEEPFARPFHAAVLDVMLAGSSTLGFAGKLAQRGIPFVFATGYSPGERQFESFPDVAVVVKPFAGEVLIEAMRAALGRRHAAVDPSTCAEIESGP